MPKSIQQINKEMDEVRLSIMDSLNRLNEYVNNNGGVAVQGYPVTYTETY